MTRGKLAVTGLTKRFGAHVAVDGVDLEVDAGSFVALLGPSGCGKTTLLRCIAGLATADAGSIRIDGRDMSELPPWRRSLGMVFQSYALFPHMTVAANVGFGLKMRGEVDGGRVGRMLELVRMSDFGTRRPAQLSGGQQQRVALARALVTEPPVLLLDEPLSALDAKLRLAMRTELRELQRRLGITTLFVTHDQDEAMAMADRVAVMDQGRIVQIADPVTLYRKPASPFVAEFVGRINRLDNIIPGIASRIAMVRPELVQLSAAGAPSDGARSDHSDAAAGLAIDGEVIDLVFVGDRIEIHVRAGDLRILSTRQSSGEPPPAIGTRVRATWRRDDLLVY
ncbi:MAG: ABC transporter ATP-binding protein [Alphaproteobacteria bacterium]|nr:ABC transporter ATP-binding protein [Alphaproteobacteria bacterium]